MLPKVNRGLTDREINTAFKGKRVLRSDCLLIFKDARSAGEPPRFAILVGKNISRKAVIRNQIRRETSSILEKRLPEFSPANFVLLLKKPLCTDCIKALSHLS